MKMKVKKCLFCRKSVHGRADKKFCDNHCRSNFSNRIHKDSNKVIWGLNQILKRNRKILEDLFLIKDEVENRFPTTKFIELGYNFHFQTHWREIELGKICVCCYDYGYVTVEEGNLAIIQLNSPTFALYD